MFLEKMNVTTQFSMRIQLLLSPTLHFAHHIESKDIEKLATELKKSKPTYISKLLESNNFQSHAYEGTHSALSSKKRCVEMKKICF